MKTFDKVLLFNLGAKRNNFYFSLCTSNIGVRGQAVHLYKLGLFESSHPVFCDYVTVFSCYNKALATFARKLLKLCGIPAIQRGYSDSVTDRRWMSVKLTVGEGRARRSLYRCRAGYIQKILRKMSNGTVSDISVSVSKYRYL